MIVLAETDSKHDMEQAAVSQLLQQDNETVVYCLFQLYINCFISWFEKHYVNDWIIIFVAINIIIYKATVYADAFVSRSVDINLFRAINILIRGSDSFNYNTKYEGILYVNHM